LSAKRVFYTWRSRGAAPGGSAGCRRDLDYVVESRIQGESADLAGEVNKMGGKISLLMDKLKKEHTKA
jgi:hypothetical protein